MLEKASRKKLTWGYWMIWLMPQRYHFVFQDSNRRPGQTRFFSDISTAREYPKLSKRCFNSTLLCVSLKQDWPSVYSRLSKHLNSAWELQKHVHLLLLAYIPQKYCSWRLNDTNTGLPGVVLGAVLTLTSSAFPSLGGHWPAPGLLHPQENSKTI